MDFYIWKELFLFCSMRLVFVLLQAGADYLVYRILGWRNKGSSEAAVCAMHTKWQIIAFHNGVGFLSINSCLSHCKQSITFMYIRTVLSNHSILKLKYRPSPFIGSVYNYPCLFSYLCIKITSHNTWAGSIVSQAMLYVCLFFKYSM